MARVIIDYGDDEVEEFILSKKLTKDVEEILKALKPSFWTCEKDENGRII